MGLWDLTEKHLKPMPKRLTAGHRLGLWLRAFHNLRPLFKGELKWRANNCEPSTSEGRTS